jgi:Cu/Ag efflux protein CusF
MKKLVAIMVMVVVALSLSMAAFAGDEEKVKGTVTKIDQAAKSVTITTKDNQVVTVVYDDASLLSKVKEGEKGEARYTTKDGKNAGVKLRKLTEGCQ